MDFTPVTNREFRRFVNATGYVTFAEIKPSAEDYPGALPHMLKAGSLVFAPPKCPVDTRDWSRWWALSEFRCKFSEGLLPCRCGALPEGPDPAPELTRSGTYPSSDGSADHQLRQGPDAERLPETPGMPAYRSAWREIIKAADEANVSGPLHRLHRL